MFEKTMFHNLKGPHVLVGTSDMEQTYSKIKYYFRTSAVSGFLIHIPSYFSFLNIFLLLNLEIIWNLKRTIDVFKNLHLFSLYQILIHS